MLVVTLLLAAVAVWGVIAGPPQQQQRAAALKPPLLWQMERPGQDAAPANLALAADLPENEAAWAELDARLRAAAETAPNLLLILEAGAAPSQEPAKAAESLAALLQDGPLDGKLALLAYDWALLDRLRALDPELFLIYGTSESAESDTVQRNRGASPWLAGADPGKAEGALAALVAQRGGQAWGPGLAGLRPMDIEEARDFGLSVIVGPISDNRHLESLIALRPQALILDDAAAAAALIAEMPGFEASSGGR